VIPYLLAWNFILELYFWLALLLLLIPTFIVATNNPYGRIGRAISRLSAPENESFLVRVKLSFGELTTSSKSTGKDFEVEIAQNKASIEKVRSTVITPLLYLIAFLAYYRLSKGFVQ
ncbi:uncharacterized protein METZ01_LOCUS379306, partial [marine metagenome]